MNRAIEQVVQSFERACCSLILLRGPDGKLEVVGHYQRPNAPTPVTPPPLAEAATQAVVTGEPAGAGLDGMTHARGAEGFAEGRTYRALAVPLQAKGRLFGGLALASVRQEEPLGESELRLLTAFGEQITASLENAQLYRVVQERETQLEELVRQLVNAQEGERARIARELHDETGQKLTALAMGLAAVEGSLAGEPARSAGLVHNLRDVADQAITELRNIMADLRPAQLDDLGLLPALRWYIGQYGARHPELAVTLNAGRMPRRLPAQYETVLFRAVQEALNNIARHAQASRVSVGLNQEDDRVRLVIADDGVGFDVSAPPKHERSSGLGLVGMRERVSLVGGKFAIESEPGHGTCITIELQDR